MAYVAFKDFASVVPLVVAAAFARGELSSGARPCIAVGDTSVQMASLPWQAERHVSFTDDPAMATVRVQLTDSAEAADFAVVDDVDSPQDNACEATAATLFVAVAATASASTPMIYLSRHGPADYRIFVSSRHFSAREAAALIVGAGSGHRPLQAASL